MSETKLAILGAGSVRCTPKVIGSLATYFGERPLEIRLFDSDQERLDLFDRYARMSFLFTRATHSLIATEVPSEALSGADLVIVQVGNNCARKYLKANQRQGFADLGDEAMIEQALDLMLGTIGEESEVLSLLPADIFVPVHRYRSVVWPPRVPVENRYEVPFQILRWIHGEDYMHEFLAENERSPVRAWLDDPESALLVENQVRL